LHLIFILDKKLLAIFYRIAENIKKLTFARRWSWPSIGSGAAMNIIGGSYVVAYHTGVPEIEINAS